MKFLLKIVIILFLAFQFLPAIVSCMDKEKGEKISLVLLDEDEDGSEESKEIKEFKEFKSEYLPSQLELQFVNFTSDKLQAADTYRLNTYTTVTVLPVLPPEFV